MSSLHAHLYILATLLLTVYGQIVVKWQVNKAGSLPEDIFGKVSFLFNLLLSPWVLSSLFAAFFAALCWMAAMTRLDLTYGYPFMSITFVLVLFLGNLFLGETITLYKSVGIVLIMAGIIVGSQG